MRQKAEGIGGKPHLDYFVESFRFSGVWFVDRQEYWTHDCDLLMQLITNSLLTKTFVGWHSIEVFMLPLAAIQSFMYLCRSGGLTGKQVAFYWCRRSLFSHITLACCYVALRLTSC